MRHLPLIIYVFLLVPLWTFSQTKNTKWLTDKFKKADTIFLISHQMIKGSTDIIVDKDGHSIDLPKLVIKDRLNKEVVKEIKTLTGNEIDKLLRILSRPNHDSVTSQGGCFVSRQSIILIKEFKTSYIDICFHCRSYRTSKDLKNIPSFNHLRWTELENYFRQNGITYELD